MQARLLAKLEYLNPGGSVKDRVARAMLADAVQSGKLQSRGTIIEPTSGNTGVGLAALAAAAGYRMIVVMPETMSMERRRLILAYGAELILTPGKEGMKGAIARAEQLALEIPGSVIAGQFVNPANPKTHYETTGPEIWADTAGKIDIFVAGVGTGGTITGAGGYLKAQNPHIEIVAVEPEGSPLLSGGSPGPHKIQGIGAGFVPAILNRHIINEIIKVSDEDAFTTARLIGREEGILVGISSGAAAWAAISLAKLPVNKNKIIVALLADGGERYLSTPLYEQERNESCSSPHEAAMPCAL